MFQMLECMDVLVNVSLLMAVYHLLINKKSFVGVFCPVLGTSPQEGCVGNGASTKKGNKANKGSGGYWL